MSNQKIIYKKDDKIMLNIMELKKFYLPILFILFFIQQSVYGQGLFNGLGISGFLAILFFVIYLFKIPKIPKDITIAYFILIFYTFIITLFGRDWKNWAISIFTLSAIGLFVGMKINQEQLKKRIYLYGDNCQHNFNHI